jgi:hypothetical protein
MDDVNPRKFINSLIKFNSKNICTGKLVILWRRGQNVLTAANMKVTTDDRIRLINGYNLEITELEPQDAGKPH